MPSEASPYVLSCADFRTVDVKAHIESRLEASVPKPSKASRVSEEEKRALELSGEIEHEHGEAREENAREAQNSKPPRHGNVKARR